jgi:SAM-dependent methyltransferase
MTVAVDPTLQALKDRARRTWAVGDYDAVAEGIWEVGQRIVRAADVRPGERVLDVAAGTGNAAIRAAEAGATVTALDLTPELFAPGRRRAAEAGVEIEWVEGDAEALPFEDGSFDVVLSTFGVMFAPRHRVAAAELARVLRPGGRLAVAAWAPDGTVGHLFRTVAAHLPPPPPVAEPPLGWGDPEHVTDRFAETGLALTFRRETLDIDPDVAIDEATAFYIESFGPLVMARRDLTALGRWEPLAAELPAAIGRLMTEPAAYLTILGRKG